MLSLRSLLPIEKQPSAHRRLTSPLLAWCVTTIALLLFSRYVVNADKMFDRACQLDHSYGNFQFDELIVTFVILAVGWLGLALLRGVKLRREVSRREQAEENALTLARYDPLTGILNRRIFLENLATAVANGRPFFVLVFDIDDFKATNDLYGHHAGDVLLRTTAVRLQDVLPEGASIARLGGDEFGALIVAEFKPSLLFPIMERLSIAVQAAIEHEGAQLTMSASVGIAGFPSNGSSGEEILNAADMAMYRVKKQGKAGFCFFEPYMEAERLECLQREEELRLAIGQGEIIPYYQPVIRLSDEQISGFEILARWDHPRLGLLSPSEFIQLAEDTRQISPLMESLLERVYAEITSFPEHLTFAFNVSPVQLTEPDLAKKILAMVQTHGVAPERIEIEITEDALVTDLDNASNFIACLRNGGVTVALDDFGTGFSSLSYLQRLKFDTIKIDQSFIQNITTSSESLKLVEIIILLASRFDLGVIAEGIESHEASSLLTDRGCVRGQGFHFGKPMPFSAAVEISTSSRCLAA